MAKAVSIKILKICGLIIFLLYIGSFIDYDSLDDPFFSNASESAKNSREWISNFDLREKIFHEHKNVDPWEEIEDIQVDMLYDSNLFWNIIENQKDWWEYLEIGRINNGKITWLGVDQFPQENSILSAKWIRLQGVPGPILEVFAETHMGNGDIYLYKVAGNKATLFFNTYAVSGQHHIGDPRESLEKYGYTECNETFRNGQLFSSYSDLNNDGILDLTLTGTNLVTCDKILEVKGNTIMKMEEVEVAESPVKETHILNPNAKCVPGQDYIYTCK